MVEKASTSSRIIPWVVVGIIAVLALVVSGLFLNSMQQSSSATSQSTTATSTNDADASSNTAQSNSDSSNPDIPAAEPVPTSEVPSVNVGTTMTLNITQWGKSLEISEKFGQLWYQLVDNNTRAELNSDLINQLPESCAAMRTEFGFMLKDNQISVTKPAQSCTEAPDIYNEIWGLLDAAAKSAN